MSIDSATGGQALSRRRLLTWFLNTSLGAALASAIYPLARFVLPPEVAEAPSVTSVVGKLSELPVNAGKIFRFGSIPALVIRKSDGTLLAYNATCTHLNCIVQYRAEVQQIWCACHNGSFDLTGKNIAGPPPRPLATLVVNTNGDDIIVSRA